MKRRLLCSLLIVAIAIFPLLAGCAQTPATQGGDSLTVEQNAQAGETATSSAVPVAGSYAYAEEDLDASWSEASSTIITLNGSGASIQGDGATANGSVVTITAAGTYVLSGSLNDGQILVDAGNNDIVRLVLNGVTLSNSSTSPIYASNAAKTVLILAEGAGNAVTDAAAYVFEEGEDEPNAAIFAKDDLSITGAGSLEVIGNYYNGIGSKDILCITGGSITVSAPQDGLRGRDGVAILDGTFIITAQNDGIKANNTDADKGFIILDGGSYRITAAHDGIQAENSLTVAGGEYTIVTGGGSANAPVQQQENNPGGFGGGNRGGGGRGGQQPGAAPDASGGGTVSTAGFSAIVASTTAEETPAGEQSGEEATTDEQDESTSMKGLKAGTSISVTGGAFTIDAEDDAVHSNGSLHIAGGSFTIQTGDDGFHADAALIVDGGSISIAKCYEGLEGATVDINGGDIDITASDDAINAAGGSDDTEGGGQMGRDRFASMDKYYIRITGGVITATAGYDAIDSNGDFYLEGGTLYLSGPSMGMDGAVDCDGSFVITGGEMLAIGSVITPSSSSTQASIFVSYTAAQEAGAVVALLDAGGNTVLSYTAETSFSQSAFTSPAISAGAIYTLTVNGEKRTDIAVSELVTTVADDGGAYAGSMGGFGGGQRQDGQDGAGGQRPDGQRPDGQRPDTATPGEMPEGMEPGQMPEGMEPGQVPEGGSGGRQGGGLGGQAPQ